jgi:thioredoxin 1
MKKEILYFSAEWCGPCKTLAPRMERLSNQINYRKIDVDNNQELSSEFGVRNIPTLILIQDGEAINRLVGLQSEQDILNFYNG